MAEFGGNVNFSAEKRQAIFEFLSSHPDMKSKDALQALKEKGIDISDATLSRYRQQLKRMIHDQLVISESIELRTQLVDATARINELGEIYEKLKQSFNDGMLWTTEHTTKVGATGKEITSERMILNDRLVYEMRMTLDDIAREVGGRTNKAIIEHRSTTDSKAFHSMLADLREKVQEEMDSLPEVSELPPADSVPMPEMNDDMERVVIDYKEEDNGNELGQSEQ